VQQILPIILCQIDDFQRSSLTTQEQLDIAKANARGSIFVPHYDSANALVFERC
jgi:hypothetical protein